MRKKTLRLVAIMLALIFLLPSSAFAFDLDDDLVNDDTVYVPKQYGAGFANPADIFNVQSVPGLPYDGYIFRLVDDIIVPRIDTIRIRPLIAPYNLFHASTMQDIVDFVAPELILYIEPNYIIFLDPMPIYYDTDDDSTATYANR